MPIAANQLARDRVHFRQSLSHDEVERLVADEMLEVLQTGEAVDASTWRLLDERFFPRRPDVTLHVYGHYGSAADFAFLKLLPSLRKLEAGQTQDGVGIEAIPRHLPRLDSLSISVLNLRSIAFLQDLDAGTLRHLSLWSSLVKTVDLAPLERFRDLLGLKLEGHKRNIEVIAELPRLRDLTLCSISLPSLSFLQRLPALRSLDLKLGGVSDVADLAALTRLRYVEAWQVRGLADVDFLAGLSALQFFFLQSLKPVTRLPDLSRLERLRKIELLSMPGLHDLTSVPTAPALEEFVHHEVKGSLAPADYAAIVAMPSLRRMSVGFSAKAKNTAVRSMVEVAGKIFGSTGSFDFRDSS